MIGACLEEMVGRMDDARLVIKEGCEKCPQSERVWLEACRLSSTEDARAVVYGGLQEHLRSVNLWLQATKLEQDDIKKSRVLRYGIECIRDSVRLWKALVDLHDKEDTVLLLHSVVSIKC